MRDRIALRKLIVDAQSRVPKMVTARTFIKKWPSFSRPVAVSCDDGQRYVLKCLQPGRPEMLTALVTEQAVGRLGMAIGAAVAPVSLVYLPQELIDAEPELSDMSAGWAHATVFEPNSSDREGIDVPRNQQNRDAYAGLSVLYGWAQAGDHQIIRKLDGSEEVMSVDHGHFFPGGPNWTRATLDGGSDAWVPDPQFAVHVPPSAVEEALERVRLTDDKVVATVLGNIHPTWGVDVEDLVAMASFLIRRRDTL